MSYPIPDTALDADIAVLGRKGGGKTFTSKGIVERLLDMGRRVLVLDPLGVWAGLRTSADGAHDGYPVAIFGGVHGDLPLDTAAAAAMADVLARENVPAVIDLSELTKHAQQGFLLAFLAELRRVNKDALTLVLEEADVFAPQNPLGDDSKALHSEIDWIARRGRFKGFRLITICQRPARLSKDVLTQAATLVVHRLPAPQDRDAVNAWVEGNGDREKAKTVYDSLATLAVGEAWVWASEEGSLLRHRFPPIKTLDTSATPKAGERRIEPKTLADVDVSAIRAALAKATPSTTKPAKNIPENIPDVRTLVEAAEIRGYERGYSTAQSDQHRTSYRSGFRDAVEKMTEAAYKFANLDPDDIEIPVSPDLQKAVDEHVRDMTERVIPEIEQDIKRRQHDAHRRRHELLAPSGPDLLARVAKDPLLQTARQVWPVRMTWGGLAAMCGRKARGGHFNTARKMLLQSGAVTEQDGLIVLTDPPEKPAGIAPADLLEANLPQPAQKMFATIRKNPHIPVQTLAEVLGMQPRGGHWNTGMSTLRRNNLIVESPGGSLRLAEGLHG